jgi:hypothetical protein
MGQSLDDQGDIYGMVHPNREGHDRMYKPRVNNALEAKVKQIRDWALLGRLLNEEGRAKRVADFKVSIRTSLSKAAAARLAALNKIQASKATSAKLVAAANKRRGKTLEDAIAENQKKAATAKKRRYPLPRKYTDHRLVSEE